MSDKDEKEFETFPLPLPSKRQGYYNGLTDGSQEERMSEEKFA